MKTESLSQEEQERIARELLRLNQEKDQLERGLAKIDANIKLLKDVATERNTWFLRARLRNGATPVSDSPNPEIIIQLVQQLFDSGQVEHIEISWIQPPTQLTHENHPQIPPV